MLLNRTHKIAAVYEQICPRPRILPPFLHTQFPLSAWARPFSLYLFLWCQLTATLFFPLSGSGKRLKEKVIAKVVLIGRCGLDTWFLRFHSQATKSQSQASRQHRNRNTKKGEAGYWQVRLTGCVLGNAVTCQLEKVRGR